MATATRLRAVGVAVALVVLVVHIRTYWFSTDDAFIAFRYARNLGDGLGLVFNPGFERVEGYSCFLWVVMLAGLHAAGWPPDAAANWLSAAAGVLVWALVVAFCWRRAPRGRWPWLVWGPAVFLAVNRSFAVWCTSGLETKVFELLVVAAVLDAIADVEAGGARWWRTAVLLALAALTRPDGLLVATTLFAARAGVDLARRRLAWGAAIRAGLLFTSIVGGHYLFRHAYYGDWFPNTYYAKLAGQSWWAMGVVYWRVFLLEYAAFVWIPLVLVGAAGDVKAGRGARPWLIGAVIVPHALYVAYCGGDHFEYRPVDLYFPLAAVLLHDGLVALAERLGRPELAAAWGALACVATVVLPVVGHLDYPVDKYRPGFPGMNARADRNQDLVRAERLPLLVALPGARAYLDAYDGGMRMLTEHLIAIRQEEHVLFLATVAPEGKVLARMVREGLMPADAFVATTAPGAMSYWSRLRTFDMLGLTERTVAHQPVRNGGVRLMAHQKQAASDYVRSRGVELVAQPLLMLTHDPEVVTDWKARLRRMDRAPRIFVSRPFFDGWYLIAGSPLAPDVVRARFPALDLRLAAAPD